MPYKLLIRYVAPLVWVIGMITTLQAQTRKGVPLDSATYYHSPRRAASLSAMIPGAGQVYNKKYWKVPIIYAGAGTMIYFAQFNNVRYRKYRSAYALRYDGDSTTYDAFVGIFSDNDLVTLKNYYRRNRDLLYICTGVLYTLNIIDAYVDGHLFYFTVNDDVVISAKPNIEISYNNITQLGLSFQLIPRK